jgi:glycosyltransferase involved in cell wall biosynthesis
MRILFVNDGVGDAGGVQQYLAAVALALRARGHELALFHVDALRSAADSPIGAGAPHFCTTTAGTQAAVAAARAWAPTLVFSHNMRDLDAEALLAREAPVVKMMHGYFGTCIGGHKMHAFPRPEVCGRRFGAACAALYLPRHCGRWNVGSLARDYAWARRQQALLEGYAALVVASEHMRLEYLRHGVAPERVISNPLFPSDVPPRAAPAPAAFHVLFLGRMTSLKGGDVLIRAVAQASRALHAPLALTLAGDGPARAAWATLARSLGVDARFPGWVDAAGRASLYEAASVVAVPSVWPEPFGLTGLEGGAYGAAAVGFDVGGISSWLHDGENGWLVNPRDGADGLARALVEAATDAASLAKRRAGARRMAERLSLGRHVDALEAVFGAAATRRSV